MTAILGAVRGVDLVVEGGGGILKDDVLVDATSLDVALVAQLSTAKPRGSAPVTGSDVEVVAVANDPNRHRCSQRAVASDGRDLQFLCPSDLVDVVIGASPFVINKASLVIALFIRSLIPPGTVRR